MALSGADRKDIRRRILTHRAAQNSLRNGVIPNKGYVFEMAWSLRYETDYGLSWDPERKAWTTRGGFAFDDLRAHDAA